MTPSATITATRAAGSYAVSDLSFFTRTGAASTSSLGERMRIHNDGKISFSSYIGDSDWNFIKSGSGSTFRLGCDISTNNCVSMTFYRAANASSSNGLQCNAYGVSNTLWIGCNNRVGVGTQSPSAQFHVAGGIASTTVGSSVTGTLTASTFTSGRTGTFADTCGIMCEEALKVGVRGIYISSDRRIKQDIQTIPAGVGIKFIHTVDPVRYEMKSDLGNYQLGYIAQTLCPDYSLVCDLHKDETMTSDGDPMSPEGYRLSVSYERIIPILHASIRYALVLVDQQQTEIQELQSQIQSLANITTALQNE